MIGMKIFVKRIVWSVRSIAHHVRHYGEHSRGLWNIWAYSALYYDE